MRKVKVFLLRRSNSVIRYLLTILGFGAVCSFNGCMYGDPIVEYGTPTATFKVKGTVKSEVTSDAIPNIKVVMRDVTTYTDDQGNFTISTRDFPADQSFLVEFDDIDGAVNGNYQPLDTLVEFIDPQFLGGSGGWDSGETEKEVNVKLKEKNDR